MGGSHSSSPSLAPSCHHTGNGNIDEIHENFDARWKRFIDSLDIPTANIKHVESLDKQKKLELLLSYEAKNPTLPVSHYVNTIKNFDWNQLLTSKKCESGMELRSLLLSIEISLRTDSVGWVYEFLNCDGLDILQHFMAICLELIFWPDELRKVESNGASTESLSRAKSQSGSSVNYSHISNHHLPSTAQENCGNIRETPRPRLPSSEQLKHFLCVDRPLIDLPRKTVSKVLKCLVKECLHLSLRCLRTILNNQHGCKRAFEHPELLNLLSFCLFHPNYSTKALVLDILTALCLIEGGHSRVLHSFDRLRQAMGEGLRFELLLSIFRHHEGLTADQYNLEFSVACVQFFNIVVHSPENINLRVYLQHELFLLGLDDTLKKLRSGADERLNQHIEAYLDNRVDCSLLLEDAEAKEAAVAALDRCEIEWTHKLNVATENLRVELENTYKTREEELSSLIESLRTRIRDLNVSSWDRENAIKKRMEELNQALKASRSEVVRLQAAVQSIKFQSSSTSSGATTASVEPSANIDGGSNPSSDSDIKELLNPEPRSNSLDANCLSAVNATSEPRSCLVNDDDLYKGSSGPQKPIRKRLQVDPGSSQPPPGEAPCIIRDVSTLRQIALNTANVLSLLVKQNSRQSSDNSGTILLPPVGWKPVTDLEMTKDTIFDSMVFYKSLKQHPLKQQDNTQTFNSVSDLWAICLKHLTEPWSSAIQNLDPDFGKENSEDTIPFRFKWLAETNLVQSNALLSLASAVEKVDLKESKLLQRLMRFDLEYKTAQRLLNQLRAETQPTSKSFGSSFFSAIEDTLEHKLGHHMTNSCFSTPAERHWFWTAVLLHSASLQQLWPAELQRLTEGLSTLLAGCTSILVNSKLPIVMRVLMEFMSHATGDQNIQGFHFQSLNTLLDWTLPTTVTRASHLEPPVNGGPPPYSSFVKDKCTKNSFSFLSAFTLLLNQVAPYVMDWPDELEHVEAAARTSITEILDRIRFLKGICECSHLIIQQLPDIEQQSIRPSIDAISNQLVHLHKAADSVCTVICSTAQWVLQSFPSTPSSCLLYGWLDPLTRFMTAFKNCAASLNKRSLRPSGEDQPPHHTPHSREHRRRRTEPHADNGGSREHRRKKHRTRQLDSDGIMDDILTGLTSQPLRADVHIKRTDSAPPSTPN